MTTKPLTKVTELGGELWTGDWNAYISGGQDLDTPVLDAKLSPVPVGSKGRWRITVEFWPDEEK